MNVISAVFSFIQNFFFFSLRTFNQHLKKNFWDFNAHVISLNVFTESTRFIIDKNKNKTEIT